MPSTLEKWQLYCADFESPDLYVDWSFYSLVSSAVQRRVWITNTNKVNGLPTHNSIFLNQFIVLVGPPAAGKSRMISNVRAAAEHEKNKRIIIDSKTQRQVMVLNAITCTPDNITFEGLFQFVAKPTVMDCIQIPSTVDGKKIETPYAHNSVSAFLEELTVMFTKNAEDVASVLCQAYDARNMHRYTKTQGIDEIRNVCVNFLAGTTTKDLRRVMNNQIIQQGFATRVIFVHAKEPRFCRWKSENTMEKQKAFDEVIERINYLSTKVIGEIQFTPEAFAFMTEHYESRKLTVYERVNNDPNLDGYYGRKKLHWQKLASIMHLAENPDSLVVGLEPVQRALGFLNKTEINMHLVFKDAGRNELNEVGKEIVAYLQQNGESTYRRLLFTFYSNGKKMEFDEILNKLELTSEIIKTGTGYKFNPTNEFIERKDKNGTE